MGSGERFVVRAQRPLVPLHYVQGVAALRQRG